MLFFNFYNEKREILQRFSRVFNRWKLNIVLSHSLLESIIIIDIASAIV